MWAADLTLFVGFANVLYRLFDSTTEHRDDLGQERRQTLAKFANSSAERLEGTGIKESVKTLVTSSQSSSNLPAPQLHQSVVGWQGNVHV